MLAGLGAFGGAHRVGEPATHPIARPARRLAVGLQSDGVLLLVGGGHAASSRLASQRAKCVTSPALRHPITQCVSSCVAGPVLGVKDWNSE